uniref:Uncharacterized protein n=1 Tax=Anguilla anguilla TaxID=7936 RepID=A0A0E9SAI8_ANGAN
MDNLWLHSLQQYRAPGQVWPESIHQSMMELFCFSHQHIL